MVVLIDSGASHNCISQKLTSALGLKVTPMVAKGIELGDGHRLFTGCHGVGVRRIGCGDGSIVVEYSRKGNHGLEKFNHAILASGSIDKIHG